MTFIWFYTNFTQSTRPYLNCGHNIGHEAAAQEIRHLDEERAPVAVQPRLQLSGKWIESSPINVVVVAGVETRELIGRFECHKVLVKRYESGVVSSESLLGKVETKVERRQRLIINVRVHTEDSARPGIKRLDLLLID